MVILFGCLIHIITCITFQFRKNMLDQDKADIRMVKELLLPDGDLYSDGQGRTRNFKWYGIDESSQLDLFDKGLWGDEHVGPDNELATEEETQRRKERFEREAFLQEENVSHPNILNPTLCLGAPT